MNGRRIAALRWGLPQHWIAWTHGDISDAHAEAAALGEEAVIEAALWAAAKQFEASITKELPGTTFAALWAPVAGLRRPEATAVLRVAAPPPEGRPSVEQALEYARGKANVPAGTKLVDVAAVPSRVTAGDAVLRVLDKAPRFTRRISREWTWFILPPGTGRMVLCQLESSSIAHFDELADMSTDIANSVEVTLEPA